MNKTIRDQLFLLGVHAIAGLVLFGIGELIKNIVLLQQGHWPPHAFFIIWAIIILLIPFIYTLIRDQNWKQTTIYISVQLAMTLIVSFLIRPFSIKVANIFEIIIGNTIFNIAFPLTCYADYRQVTIDFSFQNFSCWWIGPPYSELKTIIVGCVLILVSVLLAKAILKIKNKDAE